MMEGKQSPTAYVPPRVRDYGRLTDITAGHTNGTVVDGHFPTQVHRPMTFSN